MSEIFDSYSQDRVVIYYSAGKLCITHTQPCLSLSPPSLEPAVPENVPPDLHSPQTPNHPKCTRLDNRTTNERS